MTHSGGTAESLDESSLLASIIESAPDAIITINPEGGMLSFSPAAQAIFGYEASEVIGQNVNMLMPEPFRSAHDGYLARYLKTGEKHIIGTGRQVKAQRKNGEIFTAELAVGEVVSEDQQIFTGFIRDVTERVMAIRKAARLQRALDQVSRTQMLGEMSTALAHEINQPLSAISNFSRAARRALDAPETDMEKLSGYLDRIAEQARRSGEIIKRMRRLIERGQTDLLPEDINDIVLEATRSNLGLVDAGLHVDLELGEDLPPVLADRIQIQQVIVNLVRNAQEALTGHEDHLVHLSTGRASAIGEIRLKARRIDDDAVMVTVSDSGPGLPDHIAEDLFDPFVTGKATGLGVGLAISRSIIHSHGGKIWAENGANGGAEFHFTLPVAR